MISRGCVVPGTIFLCLLSLSSWSQSGTIRGEVRDEATLDPLIGVVVQVSGTALGTATDLDGQFTLELDPGRYDLKISYTSYAPVTITGLEVQGGQVIALPPVSMRQQGVDLSEVVITAQAVRSSEVAVLAIREKSAGLLDGISSAQFRRTGDGNAAEAARRVTGVSVEEGKYVYVRGLGDRYTKTTLNGMDIPGLDPDRNSLQLDMFPTALMDHIMVSKTFTAELPADFTGGLVNVEMKDFPEERLFTVNAGASFNPDMHLRSDFLGYEGGGTDFLGFDDGTRALPAGADAAVIPTPVSGASPGEVNRFVSSFNPQLGARRQRSFLDYSAGLSWGNQIRVGRGGRPRSLGFILSASYRSGYRYYDDVVYGEYQRLIDPGETEMRYATVQRGELGEQHVLVGLHGGLAWKTTRSKIRLNLMHLQNGESRAARFRVDNNGEAVGQSGYIAEADNLEYNQRGLTNILLHGTHSLSDGRWEVEWKVSPTYSVNEDPDIRRTAFTLTPVDTSFVAGAGGNPVRIWRSLSEVSMASRVDLVRSFLHRGREGKWKWGVSHLHRQREYEILFFDIQFFGQQEWPHPDPSVVLDPENLFPNQPNSVYYQSGNSTPNPNAYFSSVSNLAGYTSVEWLPSPRLRAILGVRAEHFVQRHTGRDQRYASGDLVSGRRLDNARVLDALDLFPTANLIWTVRERQQVRFAATRTIARPSFKELSFAQILDPVTNRIFNGSLFPYSDWNGRLTETRIVNLDLRWEKYRSEGQMVSAGVFYKHFHRPIELVRIPEQQTSTEFQPRNVGTGQVLGLELEGRRNLDFISPSAKKWFLAINLTLVESRVDMADREFLSRLEYEKEGQVTERTRRMAGQAPFIINAGLGYSSDSLGLEAGLYYNVKGPTLAVVGAGLFPDVFNEPFHSLNLGGSWRLGPERRSAVELRVTNLLDDKLEALYQSFGAVARPFSSLSPGRTFSVGYSHRF